MLGVCGAASDPLLVGSSCPFEGTREELAVHLENCRYEGLKEYLQRTDEHMVLMQDELKKKDEEIEFLKSMLARLSEKLETLDKTTNLRLGEGGEGGREGREEEEGRGEREGEGEEELVKECGECRQCCAASPACLQHEDHVHNHTEEDVSSNVDKAPAGR